MAMIWPVQVMAIVEKKFVMVVVAITRDDSGYGLERGDT